MAAVAVVAAEHYSRTLHGPGSMITIVRAEDQLLLPVQIDAGEQVITRGIPTGK